MASERKRKSFKRILKHKIFRTRNIFSLFCIIFSIVFFIFLILLGLLPDIYLVIVFIVLFTLNFFGISFLNAHRKFWLKVIGGIIITLCLLFDFLGLYYIVNTDNYLAEEFNQGKLYNKNSYYIIANKDKDYSENDIDGYIGTYVETSNLADALVKLESKFSLKEKQYNDLDILLGELNTNLINFILIDQATYEILFSISNVYHKADYSIIYDFDLFTKKKVNDSSIRDSYHIFIKGLDSYGIMDYNMIVSMNRISKEILITNIPKDYYFEVVGKQSRNDVIQYMGLYGEDVDKKSIEKLLDISIDYSVVVDSKKLVSLVDYLGGVDFCSDSDFITTHALSLNSFDEGNKLYVKKGCQNLSGMEVLSVARENNVFINGNINKQDSCQKLIKAIFNQISKPRTLLHYNETLNNFSSLFETDIPKDVFLAMVREVLLNGKKWTYSIRSLTGITGIDKVHLSNMLSQVIYPEPSSVSITSKKMKEIMTLQLVED